MSPVPVIDDHDKRSGSGTGILLLRTSIFSLVMTPYVPLVCVLLLVMQSYGPFSVLLQLHTGICNTLQVISKFRETLSMDKIMCTVDIDDPRSDGHGFSPYSRKFSTVFVRIIFVCPDRISSKKKLLSLFPPGHSFRVPDVYYTS